MLRAFALGLVFGGNPNPDAHSLFQDTIFLHTLLHIKNTGQGQDKNVVKLNISARVSS
jgi:hypothetical protein